MDSAPGTQLGNLCPTSALSTLLKQGSSGGMLGEAGSWLARRRQGHLSCSAQEHSWLLMVPHFGAGGGLEPGELVLMGLLITAGLSPLSVWGPSPSHHPPTPAPTDACTTSPRPSKKTLD